MHFRVGRINRLAFLPALAVFSLSIGGCTTASRITTQVTSVFSTSSTEKKEKAPKPPKAKKGDPTATLAFQMEVQPKEIKLSEARQLKLNIALVNEGRRFTQLHFPTTQRIEILVRDDKDHLVTQWSEDRAYEQTPGYVGINPGERVEYNTTISTRDLQAGRSYKVFAFLPNYENLRAEKEIKPLP